MMTVAGKGKGPLWPFPFHGSRCPVCLAPTRVARDVDDLLLVRAGNQCRENATFDHITNWADCLLFLSAEASEPGLLHL